MKLSRIIVFIFAIMSVVSVNADDYKTMWNTVHGHLDKDMPKKAMAALDQIASQAKSEHNYGEYLAAKMKYARIEAEVTPDSIIPAIKSLVVQARDAERQAQSATATDKQKVLSSVYHALIAKLYNTYSNTGADSLAQQMLIPDSIEYSSVQDALYGLALRYPDLLAACKASEYSRFIDKGTDDVLFNNDLLSVIGYEAGRFDFLRDYYMSKGNKRAAALSEYLLIERSFYMRDDKAKSKAKVKLAKDMETFKILPEATLFVSLYYNLLKDDGDITNASKYKFLNQNIQYYDDVCKKADREGYINKLKSELQTLTNPRLTASVADGSIVMSVRNLQSVELSVARLVGVDATSKLSLGDQKEKKELIKKAEKDTNPFRATYSYDNPVYETQTDTIELPKLEPGLYLVMVKSGDLDDYEILYNTNLTLVSLAEAEDYKSTRLAVVYSDTGIPVAGAKIHLTEETYRGKVEHECELTTDANGETHFDGSFDANRVRVYTDKTHATPDNAFRKISYSNSMSIYDNKEKSDIISVFLDRSIYRPGQTVKGAVVVHNAYDENSVHVVEGKRVFVKYTNQEGSKLRTDTIMTDSHGNAGFELTLPMNGKNGVFSISCTASNAKAAYASFRVEDYKRPTFTVEALDKEKYDDPIVIKEVIDTEKKESIFMPGLPSVNDSVVTVRFQAKTYSQLPVQGADVTYSVVRTNSFRWSSGGSRIIVPDSLITTDGKGIASISFPLTLPEDASGFFHFTVHATVTDDAGETHEDELDVCVKKIYVKKNGKPANEEKKEVRKKNEGDFSLSSSYFTDGGAVTFSMRRYKPTEKPTKACLGKAYAIYSIFDDKKLIESGHVAFDTLYTRKFEYKKEYGEAIRICYMWVMDGQSHGYTNTIYKPQPDLSLKTSWTSFRDRTQPGANETWTLHVESADKQKTPVTAASLIGTIYDKSLDAIVGTSPRYGISVLRNSFSFNNNWLASHSTKISLSFYGTTLYYQIRNPYFASFDTGILPYRSYYNRYLRTKNVRIRGRGKESAMLEMGMPEPMVMMAEAKSADGADVEDVANGTTETLVAKKDSEQLPEDNTPKEDLSQMVRTNFNETAFFTPSLSADENGNINISFTMPEAMTTWQLKGLVHDDKMRNAQVSAECVAMKDIIVKPNIPRYLREGDKGQLEANIYNTTSTDQKADVIMQFVNPVTEAVIWEHKQNVMIKAEGSEAVSFIMPEIGCDTLLIYRVVAKAKNGNSDGEQHYIPVLPAVEDVTTTVAFTQHNTGTYTKDISNILFADSRNRKLTVKYTPHAVDFLIDAVPSVVDVNRHDAMTLSTAVYVGNMFRDCASRINGGNDSIRIDSLINVATKELKELQLKDGSWSWWKGMHGSIYMTTEISKLLARLNYHGFANRETNKMLSNAMPYMLKFMKEEAKEIRKYLKKFPKEKVHPSETTTNILYINALLRENPDNYSKGGATSFKKNDTKDIKFLIGLLEKVPTEFTIYGKAHSASVLSLYGKTKKAKEFIESMKEYSVCTEEAGRYYDSPRAYYSWRNHRIPTEVAAIEALRLVTPEDSTTVEEMQKWLLHEKRTQQWDNSANTADAVYAFILDNSEIEYIKDSRSVKATHSLTDYADNRFSLDGKEIDMTGTKVQTATMPINNEHLFAVEKTTPGTSWGGLIIEQQAPLKSIKTTGSGFSVTRNIIENDVKVGDKITVRITIVADRDYDFVEVTDNRAACLEPVRQISGYQYATTGGTARGSYSGYYRETRDNKTNYYFDKLSKGTHVIETEYYVDRHGTYQQGTCSVKCAYAPEFSALLKPTKLTTK